MTTSPDRSGLPRAVLGWFEASTVVRVLGTSVMPLPYRSCHIGSARTCRGDRDTEHAHRRLRSSDVIMRIIAAFEATSHTPALVSSVRAVSYRIVPYRSISCRLGLSRKSPLPPTRRQITRASVMSTLDSDTPPSAGADGYVWRLDSSSARPRAASGQASGARARA